jgi:hypothetical protein
VPVPPESLPPPPAPLPPPPPLPPLAPVPAPELPAATVAVSPVRTADAQQSDHESVVARWGFEGRRLGSFERTPGQERGCEQACPVLLNAVGLRRWTSSGLAWNAGVAFSVGGGSGEQAGQTRTWDTHLGLGPTIGVSFLLAQSRHLAISAGPQADLVFFMPSENGSKSLLAHLRGIVEAEVHFGFIGIPNASVSASGGLQASYLRASRDDRVASAEGATRSRWGADLVGPAAPWDLLTGAQLRYYF